MRSEPSMLGCLVLLLTACEPGEATPRAALSAPPSDPLAQPLTRAARADGGPALVITGASPAALERFSRALADEPALGLDPLAYRPFVAPELHWFDGALRPAAGRPVVVRGEDPVLKDSFLIDLIAVDAADGPRYVLHPLAGAATPTPSPVDPEMLLIERELALFAVDVAAGRVQHLGDPEARRAALAVATDVPLVDEGPAVVWARAPQWSPDGAQIAFLTTRGDPTVPELWVHTLERGEERRISAPGVQVRLLGWHGDDALVVEELDDPTRPRLAVIDVDRGGLRPLADGAVIGRVGDAVVLASGPPERVHVQFYDLSAGTGAEVTALRPGELLRSWQADLSDDGSRLVLDLIDAEGRESLLVADHDGESVRVPLPGPGQLAGPPVWLGERLLVPLADLAAGTTTTHLIAAP